jgi:trk system potassium uptake protein TrkH
MIFLMYIGGASGSCAGGIKVGSLRIIYVFIIANIKGNRQAVIDKYAIDFETLNKAIILVVSSFLLIMISVFILNITECRGLLLNDARKAGFDLFFEIVSAFGTAGLSTGITSELTPIGKIIISVLMFIGRIGPVGIIAAIQSYQKKSLINRPEESLLVG